MLFRDSVKLKAAMELYQRDSSLGAMELAILLQRGVFKGWLSRAKEEDTDLYDLIKETIEVGDRFLVMAKGADGEWENADRPKLEDISKEHSELSLKVAMYILKSHFLLSGIKMPDECDCPNCKKRRKDEKFNIN